MNRVSQVIASLVLIGCVWAAVTGLPGRGIPAAAASGAAVSQDPATLDRRISMLEQRFFIIESSLRRLEQQVVQRPTPLGGQQTADTTLLRAEIERLKAHLQTVECGVAKLDERTLPRNRQTDREESQHKDPCRLNPDAPLRLPARP